MRSLTPEELGAYLNHSEMGRKYIEAKLSDGWSTRIRKADDDLANRFLSDRFAQAFSENGGSVLFEVEDWSIWPSCDNRKLFLGYRRLLGATRPLIEARAHLFDEGEIEDYRNLFNLGLMFLYDVRMTNLKTGISVSADHDDFIEFKLPSEWQEAFENYFDKKDVVWPKRGESI